MILVSGSKIVHKKIWNYISKLYLVHRGKIVVIDAVNKFDPYLISEISLVHGVTPYEVLDNIIVARSFTPFQLIKLLEQVESFHGLPLICLGINNLFEDENIPEVYAWKLFKKVVNKIKSFTMITILTADNSVANRNFIPFIENHSSVLIKENRVLKPKIRNGEKSLWEGQLHLLARF